MNNLLIIAKKEFVDLISSRLVILILAFFVLILSLSFYNNYSSYNNYSHAVDSSTFIGIFTIIICFYGSLAAVVVGFSSMSAEADGKALNTLLVKPLYRDTIINGKVLGAFCLFFCIFWCTAALYLSGLFLFFGSAISAQLPIFIEFLPLTFLLYMLCSIFLFSLSILMCVSFKEQSFALFLGFLSWILLFYVIDNRNVAGYIIDFFNLDQSTSLLVSGLWPYNLVSIIMGDTVNGGSVLAVVSDNFMFISILFLYCFVTLVLAYISFIRRDVS